METTESIRPGSLADAAGIARVHVDSWRTTYKGIFPEDIPQFSYEWRTNLWQRILGNPGRQNSVFVATTDTGEIVGFVDGGPARSEDETYKGELYAIYLQEKYQRRGLGKRLFKKMVEELVEREFYSMLLWVMEGNSAMYFYEALGGQQLRTAQEERYGVTITIVAYGWPDIRPLLTL